ncbi:hypothetical protein ABTL44_19305, partial [Acinetobacter baumannii]
YNNRGANAFARSGTLPCMHALMPSYARCQKQMQQPDPLAAFIRRIFTSNFTSQTPAHSLAGN